MAAMFTAAMLTCGPAIAATPPADGPPTPPRLALSKKTPTPKARPKGTAAFTITVRNVGMVPAFGVRLSDAMPKGLKLTSVKGRGCRAQAGRVVCRWRSVPYRSSRTVAVRARVDASARPGRHLVNTAVLRYAHRRAAARAVVVVDRPKHPLRSHPAPVRPAPAGAHPHHSAAPEKHHVSHSSHVPATHKPAAPPEQAPRPQAPRRCGPDETPAQNGSDPGASSCVCPPNASGGASGDGSGASACVCPSNGSGGGGSAANCVCPPNGSGGGSGGSNDASSDGKCGRCEHQAGGKSGKASDGCERNGLLPHTGGTVMWPAAMAVAAIAVGAVALLLTRRLRRRTR